MSLNLGQSKRSHSQPTPELSSLAGGEVEVNAAMPGAFLFQKDPWQTLGDAVPCHSCEWAAITAGLRAPGPP